MDDRAAVARIRAEKDPKVRSALFDAFVTAKEPLVRMLAERYARAEKTTAHREDIFQAGRMGLAKSIETWDPDKGALSTWAGWAIRRAVQDLARAEQPIALPQIRGTTEQRNAVVQALKKNPDVTAAELGVSEGMLDRVKKTIGLRYVSVDVFGADSDDAPARARRIERRIAEVTGDDEGAEELVDGRRLGQAVLTAARAFLVATAAQADDLVALLAAGLGAAPPYAQEMPPRPKTPPASPNSRQPERDPRCLQPRPTPSNSPLPLSRPLRPRPPLLPRARRAGSPAARMLRSVAGIRPCAPLRPRPPAPLARPLRAPPTPTASASRSGSASSRPSKVSRLPSAPRSSPPSASSRAA